MNKNIKYGLIGAAVLYGAVKVKTDVIPVVRQLRKMNRVATIAIKEKGYEPTLLNRYLIMQKITEDEEWMNAIDEADI